MFVKVYAICVVIRLEIFGVNVANVSSAEQAKLIRTINETTRSSNFTTGARNIRSLQTYVNRVGVKGSRTFHEVRTIGFSKINNDSKTITIVISKIMNTLGRIFITILLENY